MNSRRDSERGAALAEFAIVLPLILMLTFGMLTAGIAYNHKIDLSHAAREGARYATTLPQDQCTQTPNPCKKADGTAATWPQVVQQVIVDRSFGDLTLADVCVAMVDASGVVSGYSTTGSSCFSDGISDSSTRVQVKVARTGDAINAIFFKMPLTLTSQATARFEK